MKRFFEMLPDAEAQHANRKLFRGTKIEENHPKSCMITLGSTRFCSWISSLMLVFHLCSSTSTTPYKHHQYLESSDKLVASQKRIVERWCDDDKFKHIVENDDDIYNALKNLCTYLKKHWNKKVIVVRRVRLCMHGCRYYDQWYKGWPPFTTGVRTSIS